MRIAYVHRDHHVHVYRWANCFAGLGHDVHVLSAWMRDGDLHPGVTWHRIRPGHYLRPGRRPEPFQHPTPLQVVRRLGPDVANLHWSVTGDGVHRIPAATGTPLVVTVWGSDVLVDLPGWPGVYRRARNAANFRAASGITCDSELVASVIRERYAPKCDVHVIQWGVDLKAFTPAAASHEWRQRLDLPDGPVVLSTRSFRPIYNIDTIVEAIPRVIRSVSDASVVLKNTWCDDRFQIAERVSSLPCAASVRIVGEVDYDQMAAFYAMADVFVSVPSSDSSSVSLHEAMACGCTPIVSDLPANREWIEDGVNGRIVPVRDSQALAEAITDVLRDDAFRAVCRETNIKIIQDRCDHDREMARVEQLYESVIARAPSDTERA